MRLLPCFPLIFALALPAAAQAPPSEARVDVIIGFDRVPGAAEEAVVRSLGGRVRHVYHIIPAIAATVPQAAIRGLENHPLVTVVEPDVRVHALDEYSTVWGVVKIGAQAVHSITGNNNRGAGVKVCIIDSGIDHRHPDLQTRYQPNAGWNTVTNTPVGSWDYVNNDPDPFDDNGHGTHVAGTVAATLNGQGIAGVAPEVQILAYKILDASGSGDFSDAIAAVQACKDNGGRITNNSYGSSSDPGTNVKAAFDTAYNQGLLHVAAAGNARLFTCNSVAYPARYDSVVAVGATNSSDAVASWSCRGPEVELSAPGVNIYSTYPGDTYSTLSGTSMASPHVAGAAALVATCGLQDGNGDGSLNVEIRLRLQQTALDLGSAGRDTSYGFGRIRVDAAASNCGTALPPPATPTAPTALSATALSRSAITLTWTDNSSNEDGFEVERCKGSTCTNFAKVATVLPDAATYKDTALAKNTAYSYRVRAYNAAGASGYTNTATAKTLR